LETFTEHFVLSVIDYSSEPLYWEAATAISKKYLETTAISYHCNSTVTN